MAARTPAACLFRVRLELVDEAKNEPVALRIGGQRSITVLAKEADAAITRARAHVREELREGETARLVSVELVEHVDVAS
jgi:hypothetical protein